MEDTANKKTNRPTAYSAMSNIVFHQFYLVWE